VITVNEPNYTHYARIKAITADEAQWLLAIFELRDRKFRDQDEFDRLVDEEQKSAVKVLIEAIENGDLKYDSDPFAFDTDESGRKGYCFSKIRIKAADFYSWADKLNYNLPETLAKFNKDSGSEPAIEIPEDQSGKSAPEPNTPDSKSKGGKPKGYLSEAVEQVYQKLPDHGKSGLSKPSKIREFIIFMKEMATKTSRYADEIVMERIKSIRIPEEGDCIIITEDNIVTHGLDERTKRGKPYYTNNDVSKILTRLRKNNVKTE
jgi:hypothetical protein